MDIVKQLNAAAAYIENHLCEDIDIDQIAHIACVTKDSFLRFFSYMTGMTLPAYIRRRRLTCAAYDLQCTDIKVLDAAVKYGYGSAEAFTKAFVRQHGITPTQARQRGQSLNVYPPASFSILVRGAVDMHFRLLDVPQTVVYGLARPFDGPPAERFELEHMMWAEDGEAIPGQICEGYDGLWYGIWQSGTYRIAREHAYATAEGLEPFTIPAGTYAAFTTETGCFAGETLPKLRELIFQSWLPGSGYVQAGDLEVEVYHLWTDRTQRRKHRYFEIWIPVVLEGVMKR